MLTRPVVLDVAYGLQLACSWHEFAFLLLKFWSLLRLKDLSLTVSRAPRGGNPSVTAGRGAVLA